MSERIVCKPTPWFLMRAGAMILMFGIFAGMFFVDGKWGYREKNLSYHLYQSFKEAADEFSSKGSAMGAEEWRSYAADRTVNLPDDPALLPEGTERPLPWPAPLHDHAAMKESGVGNPKSYFDAYRLEAGMAKDAPEHDFDAGKIFEQWVFAWVCLALTLAALFVLLRTLGRRMWIGDGMLQTPGAKPVAVADLVRLDLRKWETKGLAYAWAKGSGGERKLRIDGLTYGGFKKEQGQPAEKLMKELKAGFSGEIIEYEAVDPAAGEAEAPKS